MSNKFIMHNGIKYIPETEVMEVYKRIYNLLKDQKEYFRTKDQSLMQSCRRRENGFIKWYESGCGTAKQVENQQSLNL